MPPARDRGHETAFSESEPSRSQLGRQFPVIPRIGSLSKNGTIYGSKLSSAEHVERYRIGRSTRSSVDPATITSDELIGALREVKNYRCRPRLAGSQSKSAR